MPQPIGVLGVIQTPFTEALELDLPSHERLVLDALEAGVDGFLVPAVASENAFLTFDEKILLASRVQAIAGHRVPIIWGAGSFDPQVCAQVAEVALRAGALAILVAVPPDLYRHPMDIVPFFRDIGRRTALSLMIQDWDPAGPGMTVETISALYEQIPTFRYLKVETVPAGPKYSQVLEATQGKLHVSGGWAVQQMIEALDRGVHAMIPECSAMRVYKRIDTLHRSNHREEARHLFNQFLPVLCFTNQQLEISIRFFKRLLVKKGLFRTAQVRLTSPDFDSFQERISEELIECVLRIERSSGSPAPGG